jgi:chemotaxis family two-component system response regulator Rcp1
MSMRRIVLVEDNPADVLLVQKALEANGVACAMTHFDTGLEALKALCPPDGADADLFVPDAILLDLNTPKSDGFNVLIRLKNTPHLADVPIAIITSSQTRSDKARSDALGAVRYIQKPSGLDEFLSTVGRAVKEMLAV